MKIRKLLTVLAVILIIGSVVSARGKGEAG